MLCGADALEFIKDKNTYQFIMILASEKWLRYNHGSYKLKEM